MSEEKNNNKFALSVLKEKEGCIEFNTTGGVLIPVTLELLKKITYVPPNKREPNTAELMMFANMCIEQKANPYLKECWLVQMQGQYQPIIAAQVRLRKAQSMPDYDGYEWGWITTDGDRCEPGRAGKAMPDSIVGVWGQVTRKGISQPFYHETFVSEYTKRTESGKGNWEQRPITMILKVNRDQTHKFAYADQMGNLQTENEIIQTPEPSHDADTPRREERKQVESEQVETNPIIEDAILDTFKKFMAKTGMDTNEEFADFAALALECESDDLLDFNNNINPNSFDLDKLAKVRLAIDEFVPEEAPKEDESEPEPFPPYVCKRCGNTYKRKPKDMKCKCLGEVIENEPAATT